MPKRAKKYKHGLQEIEFYITGSALLYTKTKKIKELVRIGKELGTNRDIYIEKKN